MREYGVSCSCCTKCSQERRHSRTKVLDMTFLDLRVIFDEEEQQFVVGCHNCETYKQVPLSDIPHAAVLLPEFALEHMKKCGTIQ